MSTRPSVVGSVMSSLPDDRHAAETHEHRELIRISWQRDIEALPGAVPCRGAFPYRAGPLGE